LLGSITVTEKGAAHDTEKSISDATMNPALKIDLSADSNNKQGAFFNIKRKSWAAENRTVTGVWIDGYMPADNGYEVSNLHSVQTGGGGSISSYCLSRLRPDGYVKAHSLDGNCNESFADHGGGVMFLRGVENSADICAISAIQRASNAVTVTCSAAHPFSVGDKLVVSGVTDPSFDGSFTIATAATPSFTYSQSGADATSSGGTSREAFAAPILVASQQSRHAEARGIHLSYLAPNDPPNAAQTAILLSNNANTVRPFTVDWFGNVTMHRTLTVGSTGTIGQIRLLNAGAWPVTFDQSTGSVFSITNGGQQRFLLTGGGTVGIGVAAPNSDTRLHVKDGHVSVSATASPTLSSCGTNPSIAGSDNAGKITMGSGALTSCTATFAAAWTNAPACATNDESASAIVAATNSTTTTAMTIRATSLTSKVISYICVGY
jgi:hypothetical protein